MRIRDEAPGDVDAIRALVRDAFANAAHASGTEHRIVDALRDRGELVVALVAEDDAGAIAGHVAFSAVRVEERDVGWYGLGPVAVRPDAQGRGIGRTLVEAGLARLRALDAHGCVLAGDPAYYGRFGFRADPTLVYSGLPPDYFLSLRFAGPMPAGRVDYSPAFSVS